MTAEEVLCDDEVENGVSKELKTLIGGYALFCVRVDVGAMTECEVEELGVGKTVLQLALEAGQPFRRLAPEKAGDAS